MERSISTILLADDEEVVLSLMALFLEREGHRVLTAKSGQEALALAEKHDFSIDLMIADVDMPVMSGLELARRFSESNPRTPILFVSGATQEMDFNRPDFRPRPVYFLPKPFHFGRLGEKVKQVMRHSSRD